MRLVRLQARDAWPAFDAAHDPDLGWTAECISLGVMARGSTWSELMINCARGIEAVLAPEDADGLATLGFDVDGQSGAPGDGTRYDVAFEVRRAPPGATPGRAMMPSDPDS